MSDWRNFGVLPLSSNYSQHPHFEDPTLLNLRHRFHPCFGFSMVLMAGALGWWCWTFASSHQLGSSQWFCVQLFTGSSERCLAELKFGRDGAWWGKSWKMRILSLYKFDLLIGLFVFDFIYVTCNMKLFMCLFFLEYTSRKTNGTLKKVLSQALHAAASGLSVPLFCKGYCWGITC